jgi:ABC-2 type transport system ATP-binding protein
VNLEPPVEGTGFEPAAGPGGAPAGGASSGGAPAAGLMVAADHLSRRFGDLVAVAEVSFEAVRGELFGLVGPDGSGKTTLLRMLAGVLRPSSGDALVGGVSVTREPERLKHHIAYMSQRFGLYADLTVRENLDFYADLYRVGCRERVERLERLFRFSGLASFQDRLAGQLSGGMKQKLGLSCALVHQPEILLLDEPTFGVDPISRRDLWLIVHEMTAQGVTVVVSTSYLDEAERFDRLALLHRGRVLALDTPEALRRSAGGELLAVRLDRPQEARRAAARLPEVRRAAIFGEWLHLTVGSAATDGAAVAAALGAAGLAVRETTRIAPSLEDVFMDCVARAEET